MSNKRLIKILENRGGQMQDGDFLDCYNQKILRGVSGTILTGISFRCMHYVIEIKNTPSDSDRLH